jgi:DNA primase
VTDRSRIDDAKARHSLSEVAARTGIHLRPGRAGSVTVRCPMPTHGHPDRTPSLRLHLTSGIWFCFACSPLTADGTPQGADVIDWVRRTERVGIGDAIRLLDSGATFTNAWAGHASDYRRPATTAAEWETPDLERTPAQRVSEALQAAWAVYTSGPLHQRGVHYLASRWIAVTVLERRTGRPEVGHTYPGRDDLVGALQVRGFTSDELVDAGLASRRLGERRTTDFYRQRALIPIRSIDGQIAGIVGRNVGDPRYPKYKNPPRTHLYDKSVNLYQPLPGPPARDGQVVIVEGTLDAMAIAVAAIRSGLDDKFCPVTQSGRELSPEQLDRVLALHPMPPVVAFDGDQPGRESNVRLAIAAVHRHREVVITTLPDDHDPASWLAEHGDVGLAAWIRKGCLDPSRTGTRPALAAKVLVDQFGRSEEPDRERSWLPRRSGVRSLRDELVELGARLPRHASERWMTACNKTLGLVDSAERGPLEVVSPTWERHAEETVNEGIAL